MMSWLKGKKTMIGSVLAGALLIGWSLNLIDEAAAKGLLGLVMAWTGVSLRLAIKNSR